MKWRAPLYAAIVVAGAALRLIGLGRESLWHDEAWSWWLATQPVGEMLRSLREVDGHPPLYYLVLGAWLKLGDSEAWMRLPSAIFGIATLPFVERLGRRLAGPGAGLLAMAFIALSPYHIYFSQEARAYTLLFLEAAILLDLLGVEHKWKWAGVAALVAAIMYTHYLGALLLLAITPMIGRAQWRPALAGLGGAVLLYIPWMPTAYHHLFIVNKGFWIQAPTPFTILQALRDLTVAPVPVPAAMWGLAAFVVALAIAAPWIARERRLAVWFLPWAVPIVIAVLLSLYRPLFYTRTLMYVLLPIALLAAVAVVKLPDWARPGAAVILLGAMVPGIIAVRGGLHKEDWRGCAETIRTHYKPDHAVIVYPGYLDRSVKYYLRSEARVWIAGTPPQSWSHDAARDRAAWEELMRTVRDRRPASVWMVRRPDEFLLYPPDFTELDAAYPNRFSDGRRNTEVILWRR